METGTSVDQPKPELGHVPPAIQVAPRGNEAGPFNQPPRVSSLHKIDSTLLACTTSSMLKKWASKKYGKRKKLDNYRADSDSTSKAYGLGQLTKLLISDIDLHLIFLSLAFVLGVVKQGVSEIDPD
ncbi:hypothetical protein HAX54_017200 [Datura stramonium]|uniref:Uncharacterized protein n=1 Tax=Datura stramonium TaxID=4076 RepID=A0ABS8S0J4_DATST|nr:hypothetical protein [Datura stramonium]